MKALHLAALAGVTVILSAAAASADAPIPHLKPGLWQSTLAGEKMSSLYCVDAASDAKMSGLSSASGHKNCKSSPVVHSTGGTWTITSTCEFIPGKVETSHIVVTGDFTSTYHMEMSVDGHAKPEMNMTMTYAGACKPGMKGGDVVMSNGMKMNILDGTMSGVPK